MLIKLDYDYHPVPRAASPHISKLLASHEDTYRHLLNAMSLHVSSFEKIPIDEKPPAGTPFWVNGYIPALDAASLYTIVTKYNPRLYVEVGSGNSTKFVRQAIVDNRLRTRIVSIDPMPRAEIDAISDVVIRAPLENTDLNIFRELQDGDVVFIDNSHRSFQSSDVTVFFTEILPMLNGGVVYGLHDIFLPYDYPSSWTERFYNEQYLLHAYLIGGRGGDEILFPVAYVSRHPDGKFQKLINEIFERPSLLGVEEHGGCFWLVKSAQR